MRRLPPLDSLRAFEAAARHLSFSKAAEEIHVTPSAISHRIRTLEDELGYHLFRRLTRRLELTPKGVALAAAVQTALAEIAQAIAGFERPAPTGQLTLSVLPSLATRWLVPRLIDFHDRHPAIEIRIQAHERHADLRSGEADLAIRFGRGRYPGLDSTLLMPDAVLPVCSPRLLAARGKPADAAELAGWPLLYDSAAEQDGSGADWQSWWRHAGHPQLRGRGGQQFSQAHLAIDAAAAGLGVALARRSLIIDDLGSGRLVVPIDIAAPTVFSYWLVCLPESVHDPRVSAFRDWLLGEAERSTAAPSRPRLIAES